MTDPSKFKLNPEVRQNLEKLLSAAEGGTARAGFVDNAKSGLSVGRLQLDLSKNTELAKSLFDAARRTKLPELAGVEENDLKKTHGAVDAAGKARIENLVNATLKTEAGRQAVKNAEAEQLGYVQSAVERVCAKAGPDAAAFCNSPEGQRELAAYAHQYGPNETGKLEAFLAGKEVTLGADKNGKGGTNVKIDGPLTVEGFRKGYRDVTTWGRENPAPAKTRDGLVDEFNRKNPVAPAATPQASDAGAPDAAERKSAAAPVNLLLPQDGAASEMAMASDEPAAEPDESGAWRKPAKIELRGTAGTLFDANATRSGRPKAVKLLQATINDANRPAAFDWNWGKTGRIDVDGDLGPQTLAGFERAAASEGEDGFARRYAHAQFRDYARRLDKGTARYEDLPGTLDGTLGRLDADAATGFQDMLNDVRDDLPDHVRYRPLLRDGQIGPVTTDAFRTALYALGPDRLAGRFDEVFAG